MAQLLEAVAFDVDTYYNGLQYLTNANKLKACQGGLKWITLTESKPVRTVNIHIRPKTKFMNEYNFFGLLVGVPDADTMYQYANTGDTTADVSHIEAGVITRYYEWSEGFNMGRV